MSKSKMIKFLLLLLIIGVYFVISYFLFLNNNRNSNNQTSILQSDIEKLSENLVQNNSFEDNNNFWQIAIQTKKDYFKKIKINDAYHLTMPLSLDYLDQAMKIKYTPKKFKGSLPKNIIFFEFFNQNSEVLSRLTYLLNGESNYAALNNVISNNIPYLTIEKNDNQIGKTNKISLNNILQDQNDAAAKINGNQLKKADIDHATVTILSWYEPGTMGQISSEYEGWDNYILFAETPTDNLIKFSSLDDNSLQQSYIYQTNFLPSDGLKQLDITSPVGKEVSYQQAIPVITGKPYLVVFNTKKKAGMDSPEIKISNKDGTKNYFSEKVDIHFAMTGWVQAGGIFIAKEDNIDLQLLCPNTKRVEGDEHCYFDNIRLIELPSLNTKLLNQLINDNLNLEINNSKIKQVVFDYKNLYSPTMADNINQEYKNLNLPIYDLSIDEKKLYDGGVDNMKDNKVSGIFKYNGLEYKVKVRVRGDNLLHFATPTKSLRIDFNDPKIFDNKNSINLLRPVSRDFIHEDYSSFISKTLNLIVPEDKFVYLRVNGRPYGIMYEIEQWSEEIMEKAQKPVSDLYQAEISNEDSNTDPEFFYKKTLPKYWSKYTADPSLPEDDETNIFLLVNFMNNDYLEGFEKMVNLDSLIRWNAQSILVGSAHQDYSHNNRLYFNNTTGQFEFIPWDLRWSFHQTGQDRVNPYMDFALKNITTYDQRNNLLWQYLSKAENQSNAINYYQKLADNTAQGFQATEHYTFNGEDLSSYTEVKDFIDYVGTDIETQFKKITDLLKKNTTIKSTFKKIENTNNNQVITSLELEPTDDTMFSSAIVKNISINPNIQSNISIYYDNGDSIFNQTKDQCILGCQNNSQADNTTLNIPIPSKVQYQTYVAVPPWNLTEKNFQKLKQTELLSDKEKDILDRVYAYDQQQKVYQLNDPRHNPELWTIFEKINYTPQYKKPIFFILGNNTSTDDLINNISVEAVNAVTNANLNIAYFNQGNQILKDIQANDNSTVYELRPEILNQTIKIKYHPQKFIGQDAKSLATFTFFNQDNDEISKLSYILNSTSDYIMPDDTIENNISNLTIQKQTQLNKINQVIFEPLKDQNISATKINAVPLTIQDIYKTTVTLETWFDPEDTQGSILISYDGWKQYTVNAQNNNDENILLSGPLITPPTEAEIIGRLKNNNLLNVNYSLYQDLSAISTSEENFSKKYPIFSQDQSNNSTFILHSDTYNIKENIIIPSGISLIIEPGTTLKFNSGISLISYGHLTAIGTAEKPIKFTNMLLRTWGVVGVIGQSAEANFENCIFEKGSDEHINGIYFSGMLSVYHTNAILKNSEIKYSKISDDAVNFKYGIFTVENNYFYKNQADALDFDFAQQGSIIKNNYFYGNGNDGLDLSGSSVEITNNHIAKSGDKCISIGEQSMVEIKNNLLEKCNFGLSVKDSSQAIVIKNDIINNNVGVSAYNKKELFGGSKITLYNSNLVKNQQDFGLEQFSNNDFRQNLEQYASQIIFYNSTNSRSSKITKEIIRLPKENTLKPKKFIKAYLEDNLDQFGFKFANLLNQAEVGDEKNNPYISQSIGADKNLIGLTN
ncbi:hypothetical protein A2533_02595 [Candidatus Falkowbacteria bacterium RIFOXYD2_FULL_35_9]|uniref:Right handed beta helix domain-containing protein n=1 Tax=Candidatus Falkowbacteria bacterium RIFOXYC2_FULL_36_12 TaxID=1798002 RepID=A0A1F5T3H6_9BACT|nr:MAG: hypothetical protein A2300_03095 [Candidatus Falkowbacteria bacterium RIFOXYB2_FULL_35_7]OGF33514.1 MAG: hypothetical protein A2478_02400 [Candidatus Falkowbacteria bacterium RIFOXYC2_FULL_36_12]OGF33726.1 MAG: hypothetical protein A2223_01520 [Candidatus Falkowbacteria bacterium RIFOXYA2_FULL_35_8]OGF48073.1 MAG: hypothetical protein A2533_02595 [Candidatus Falkowbacteria bacterium RIFOXYD2_FULL_35_9]